MHVAPGRSSSSHLATLAANREGPVVESVTTTQTASCCFDCYWTPGWAAVPWG